MRYANAIVLVQGQGLGRETPWTLASRLLCYTWAAVARNTDYYQKGGGMALRNGCLFDRTSR